MTSKITLTVEFTLYIDVAFKDGGAEVAWVE